MLSAVPTSTEGEPWLPQVLNGKAHLLQWLQEENQLLSVGGELGSVGGELGGELGELGSELGNRCVRSHVLSQTCQVLKFVGCVCEVIRD